MFWLDFAYVSGSTWPGPTQDSGLRTNKQRANGEPIEHHFLPLPGFTNDGYEPARSAGTAPETIERKQLKLTHNTRTRDTSPPQGPPLTCSVNKIKTFTFLAIPQIFSHSWWSVSVSQARRGRAGSASTRAHEHTSTRRELGGCSAMIVWIILVPGYAR